MKNSLNFISLSLIIPYSRTVLQEPRKRNINIPLLLRASRPPNYASRLLLHILSYALRMLEENMIHKRLHIAIDARPAAFSAAEHAAVAAPALLGIGGHRLLLDVRLCEEDPSVPDPDG